MLEGESLEPARFPTETILEEDSLDDEVFFDNKSHGTSALDLRAGAPIMGGGDMVASAGFSPTTPLIIPSPVAEDLAA